MAPSLLPLISKPSLESSSTPKLVLITSAYSVITITILFWSSKIFLFCPRPPTVQLNNLLVSSFKVSDTYLEAIFSADLTVCNPNVALSVQMNQIEASVLYKNGNALSFTSVDDFELCSGERKDVYAKFETTGNEGDQPIVEFPVLREIKKDCRRGEMGFRINLSATIRYEIGLPGWKRRPLITNVIPYSVDLDVNVGDGRVSIVSFNGDSPLDAHWIRMVTDQIQV